LARISSSVSAAGGSIGLFIGLGGLVAAASRRIGSAHALRK